MVIPVSKICTDIEWTYQYRTHTKTYMHHVQGHDRQPRCEIHKNYMNVSLYTKYRKDNLLLFCTQNIHKLSLNT